MRQHTIRPAELTSGNAAPGSYRKTLATVPPGMGHGFARNVKPPERAVQNETELRATERRRNVSDGLPSLARSIDRP